CGAAEIQRIAENAPRWPDVNTSALSMRVDANQMANFRLRQTKARALGDNLALLGSRLEGRHSCLSASAPGWQLVGERAVNQLLDQLAVIGADRAGRLAHVDGGELLLGVDPEIGSGIAGPHELARRAWHAGDPPSSMAIPQAIAVSL